MLDTKYTYALGVIRAREVKLLTEKRFEELLSSVGVEELISAMHDTDYGEYLRNVGKYEAEKALHTATKLSLFIR